MRKKEKIVKNVGCWVNSFSDPPVFPVFAGEKTGIFSWEEGECWKKHGKNLDERRLFGYNELCPEKMPDNIFGPG